MKTRAQELRLAALLTLPLSLAACGGEANEFVPPPPPPVTVALPTVQDVTRYVEMTGITEPVRRIDLRARVKGFVKEITYQPGARVEAGARLFLIDPALFQAQVDLARANVQAAEADLSLAQTTVSKLEEALKTNAVSKLQVEEAASKRDVAKAALAISQAQLEQAQLDLGYTDVRAPIAGRVSRRLVEVGDLVGASEPTLLATLVDDSQVYAYANVPERTVLESIAAQRDGGKPAPDEVDLPIEMKLETDSGYPFNGRVDYFDPEINRKTGTLSLRAVFDNPERRILAGVFVRMRIPVATQKDALLVSEGALGVDPRGNYVLVVGSGDVVEYRAVQVGTIADREVEIVEGITREDRVIVSGVQRARPGAKVSPATAPAAGA